MNFALQVKLCENDIISMRNRELGTLALLLCPCAPFASLRLVAGASRASVVASSKLVW